MGITIKILDLAAFVRLLRLIDEGTPGTERATKHLLNGDLYAALLSLEEGAKYIYTTGGFSELLGILTKRGVVKLITDSLDLKKSFSFGNITIGI